MLSPRRIPISLRRGLEGPLSLIDLVEHYLEVMVLSWYPSFFRKMACPRTLPFCTGERSWCGGWDSRTNLLVHMRVTLSGSVVIAGSSSRLESCTSKPHSYHHGSWNPHLVFCDMPEAV